jgi:hypothetical protein
VATEYKLGEVTNDTARLQPFYSKISGLLAQETEVLKMSEQAATELKQNIKCLFLLSHEHYVDVYVVCLTLLQVSAVQTAIIR